MKDEGHANQNEKRSAFSSTVAKVQADAIVTERERVPGVVQRGRGRIRENNRTDHGMAAARTTAR